MRSRWSWHSEFPSDKVTLTGNPCSERALSAKKAKKEDYGLSKDKRLVLIVMGSLGSRTVNEKITTYLESFRQKDYEVAFVTGETYYEKVKKLRVPGNVKIIPFVKELPSLMKCSDLIVSRAGASTISEITVLGIPTIFIPSPYVTNNHQYKNAKDLMDKKAAFLIEEEKLTKDLLINTIDNVLNNEKLYDETKKNLIPLGIKDSSSRIYEILKEMILDDKKFF